MHTFEQEHVHSVYSQIAQHFSQTRYKPWPVVEAFIHSLPTSSIVADVGCGNGKYLAIRKDCFFVGSDFCIELAKIAHSKQHETIVADTLALPFRNASFDYAISIAVIHHLSTQERRRDAIIQLLRIVKQNGHILIYVWAMEQSVIKLVI